MARNGRSYKFCWREIEVEEEVEVEVEGPSTSTSTSSFSANLKSGISNFIRPGTRPGGYFRQKMETRTETNENKRNAQSTSQMICDNETLHDTNTVCMMYDV